MGFVSLFKTARNSRDKPRDIRMKQVGATYVCNTGGWRDTATYPYLEPQPNTNFTKPTQGLGEPVLTTFRATPGSAIESTTAKLPESIGDGAFIFTFLFQPNLEGLAARAALQSTAARQAVQKKGSVWPECGIKPARFAPRKYHREVLQFQGYLEEDQMGYFQGKKGGKGGGRDGSNAAPGKRAASHRLSVSAPKDAKRR